VIVQIVPQAKHHFWTRVRWDHQLPISRGSQVGLPLCRHWAHLVDFSR